MHCQPRTMLIVALALIAAALTTYFVFPAAQAFILANGPWLLFLVCPLSMAAMMWTMRGGSHGGSCHGNARNPELPAAAEAGKR